MSGLKMLFFSFLFLLLPPLSSQSTRMVLDICRKQAGSIDSYPREMTWFKGWWYFSARNVENGGEMWRSQGSEATTELFHEFRPGPLGVLLSELTPAGSFLFFSASKSKEGGGDVLWLTDGTKAGTREVKTSGDVPMYPRNLFAWKGLVFFAGKTEGHGYELWRSDGTSKGTYMVKDISPGPAWSYPRGFAVQGGSLFFKADDGTHGLELWKSDGTGGGTVMVKDVFPGKDDGVGAGMLVPAAGTLFFPGRDAGHGEELWKTDGTSSGTVLVKDIRKNESGSRPLTFGVAFKGSLIFTCDDGVHGQEVWESDGTEAGTSLVNDINSGDHGSFPREFTVVGDGVFFTAVADHKGYYAGMRDLWRLLPAGTGKFRVQRWNTRGAVDAPFGLTALGNPGTYKEIVFRAENFERNSNKGAELWISSTGSPYTTKLLKDIEPGKVSSSPTYFCSDGNGRVLFCAKTVNEGAEPWITDGTARGTVRVKDICRPPLRNLGSGPSSLTDVYGTLFFTATDWDHGYELWKTDGTAAGTVMVKDIRQKGNGGTYMAYFTPLGATLFFQCDDGIHGRELWKSDGTEAGTVMVKDIRPGKDSSGRPLSSKPLSSSAPLKGVLLFSADGGEGEELWRTDGTVSGTTLVKDIRPGAEGSHPRGMTRVGDKVFFQADDGKAGAELWVTDGTPGGTLLVKDIHPGSPSSRPICFRGLGGTLFFVAQDGVHGREIWKSDGTGNGTVLLKDVNPGKGDGAWCMEVVGDLLFFAGDDGVHGRELWKSDGTAAGTAMVKDINPGPGWSTPGLFTPLGKTCIFRCNFSTGRGDFEIWKSDGTAGGTTLLKDINKGAGSSYPFFLTPVGSRYVYFSANDGVNGSELWRTDGTSKGTVLVEDILPGKASSSCSYLTQSNGFLFFRATDLLHGTEIWLSDPGGTTQDFGSGTAGARGGPRLKATDPIPGLSLEFEGKRFPVGGGVLLAMGLRAPRPLYVFPGFPVHLDLSGSWVCAFPSVASHSGNWKWRLPIPGGTSLLGRGFICQAWIVSPGNPGALEASNGLFLRVGF